MPPRSKGAFRGNYPLTGIPADLWERAKAKAASYRPPLSMRWVIIQLLERWAPAPKCQPPRVSVREAMAAKKAREEQAS